MVRFFADESCDFLVVRALRGAGHDVVAVAESSPQTADGEVLARARSEGRVLITEDKDFGQLVFSAGAVTSGVLFIRFPAYSRAGLGSAVVETCDRLGDALARSFVVLEPGRLRVTRLPGRSS